MPECMVCGDKAVYTRRYSGECLCSGCFRGSIVGKVRRTISKYHMISYRDKVGVAVSGGKDSLSLLQILHKITRKNNNPIVALTVDEGVKGYREEAIEHVRKVAGDLEVPVVLVSYKELFGKSLDEALDWKDERNISSCSICGVFRRRAIDEAGAKAGVNVIATAHNLDDYVQTFMMNLFNGDVGKVGWLDPGQTDATFPLRRVKPFLEVYEEEIALYAYLSGLPFQSISCPYMHEALRSEVRDYLNEMEANHPGMKNVLLHSSLQVASNLSESTGKSPSVPCTICGKPSSSGVCNVCAMKSLVKQHVK